MSKSHSRSLAKLTPGGGGGAKSNFAPGVGLRPLDTLKQALGKKGRKESIENAARNSNPFYHPDYSEFSENCQRAVIAYEARRRGYDVVAQPTYQGDNLPATAHVDNNGLRHGFWMGAFQGAKPILVGATRASTAQRRFEAQMREFGNGARAIMQVVWKGNPRTGHVINVENVGGRIRYIDAQVGGEYRASALFNAIRTGETQIVRTDNLRLSERAKRSVEQSDRRTGQRARRE